MKRLKLFSSITICLFALNLKVWAQEQIITFAGDGIIGASGN